MAGTAKNSVFSKRDRKHVLILASGEDVRHMTLRPWLMGLTVAILCLLSVGYLAATSYLVMRDDLIGASMARQANIQQEYEDRIAALRAQVDRITSRQLLDQQVVEKKVEKLLQQQLALSSRHGLINNLIDRAENSGLMNKPDSAAPADKSDDHAQLQNAETNLSTLIAAVDPKASDSVSGASQHDSVADRADKLFSAVTFSLKKIEQDQMTKINVLTQGAASTADAIQSILRRTGIDVAATNPENEDQEAVGGPYLAPQPESQFETSLGDLDLALQRLEDARKQVKSLPFANPAPGKTITSTFGNRVDPFFGTMAMHAGIDFREPYGEPIRSTGAGTVTAAGPNGSYGNMVEVTHGDGIVTRYGHLSRVIAKMGAKVEIGDVIGEAGSTGRSTGTHLHYEVRRNDVAVDPMRFLNAGAKLTSLLD